MDWIRLPKATSVAFVTRSRLVVRPRHMSWGKELLSLHQDDSLALRAFFSHNGGVHWAQSKGWLNTEAEEKATHAHIHTHEHTSFTHTRARTHTHNMPRRPDAGARKKRLWRWAERTWHRPSV